MQKSVSMFESARKSVVEANAPWQHVFHGVRYEQNGIKLADCRLRHNYMDELAKIRVGDVVIGREREKDKSPARTTTLKWNDLSELLTNYFVFYKIVSLPATADGHFDVQWCGATKVTAFAPFSCHSIRCESAKINPAGLVLSVIDNAHPDLAKLLDHLEKVELYFDLHVKFIVYTHLHLCVQDIAQPIGFGCTVEIMGNISSRVANDNSGKRFNGLLYSRFVS